MSSSNSEAKTYVDLNHAFLKKALSQPLVHIDAKNNRRAFMEVFINSGCFSPELQALAEKSASQLDGKLRAAYPDPNQSGNDFLEQQRRKSTALSLDELKVQQAEALSALYNYIFDADGNYTDAFNVPDIDQFLKDRGLTKQDLFWQYVQQYQNTVYVTLAMKFNDVLPPEESEYLEPVLNTVYNPAFGDAESGRKVACAFFDEKFFGPDEVKAEEESKEESKEPSSQFERPWPDDIRTCQWLPTARDEAQEDKENKDTVFKLKPGIMYVNQVVGGNLSCRYLDRTGQEKMVKISAAAFSAEAPAPKTKAMNQFCERLGRLKQATKDSPFSEEDSAAFLNSMVDFSPVVRPVPVKPLARKRLDFTNEAPVARKGVDFTAKGSVWGYKKGLDELNVLEGGDEGAKREQSHAELDAAVERKRERRSKKEAGKEKEEVKPQAKEEPFVRYVLLQDRQEKDQLIPKETTASVDIVRINTESPLRGPKTTYQKAASHPTYKLENKIEEDDSKVIPALLSNLRKIETGEWVESLHGYEKEGIQKAEKNLLAADLKLYEELNFGDPNELAIPKDNLEYNPKKELLKLRIAKQKEAIKEWKLKATPIDDNIVIKKARVQQHWNDSGIGHKRTACQPVFDRLGKAIQENIVNRLDIATLFEFRTKLTELRVAHELLNANLNRPTLASNINNLEKLIAIVEKEIIDQLIALGTPKEKIAQILKQPEEKALADVVKLYFKETVSSIQERAVRVRLKTLYNNKQISTHQFIFACNCFAQDKKLRLTFARLYTGVTGDSDMILAFITALMIPEITSEKREKLSRLINSLTPEKVDKEQFILACEVLSKDDVYAAVIKEVSAEYKNRKDVLCNLLKNKKITEDEFVYMVKQLSDEADDTDIVATFIAIARARPVIFKNEYGQESNMRENLYCLFKNGKISKDIYYFALQQLKVKPALAESVFLIGDTVKQNLIDDSYALLCGRRISEDDFIEIALPAKTESMPENQIQKAMDTKKRNIEKYNKSIAALKDKLARLKEEFSDFSTEGNIEKFSFLQSIITQDIDVLMNIETPQQERDVLLLKLCRQAMWIDNHCKIEEKDSFLDVAIELLELRASVELKKSAEYQFLMQCKEVKKGINPDSNNMESRLLTQLNTTMRQFYTLAQDLPAEEQSEGYTVASSLAQERKPNPKAQSGSSTKKRLQDFQKKMEAKSTLGKKISSVVGIIGGLALMAAGVAACLSIALISIGPAIFEDGLALFEESKSKWDRACKEENALKALSETVVPQLEAAARPNTVAFFDVDKTCIQWDGTPSLAAQAFKKDFAQTVALTARDKRESLKNFHDAFLMIIEEAHKLFPNDVEKLKAHIKKRIEDLERIKLEEIKKTFGFQTIHTLRDLEKKKDGTPEYGLGNYYDSVLKEFENIVYKELSEVLERYLNSNRFSKDLGRGVNAVKLAMDNIIGEKKKSLEEKFKDNDKAPCSATKSDVIQSVLEQDKAIVAACLLDDAERHRVLLECDVFNHPSRFTTPVYTVVADAEKKEEFTDERYRKEYQAKVEARKEKTHPLIPLTHSKHASSIFKSIEAEVLDDVDEQGHTVLHHVALVGDIKAALFLMERISALRISLEAKDNQDKTPLTIHNTKGKSLLQTKDENGKTLLHLIVESNRDTMLTWLIENIDLFMENGADINAKDNNGKTVLQCAAEKGQTKIVSMLIQHGAHVDTTDNNGKTALNYAINEKEAEIIAILAEAGFDLTGAAANVEDEYHNTPLYYAIRNGQKKAITAMLKMEPIIVLKGMEIDLQASLHAAAECGNIKVIKALLAIDADVNAVNEYNLTPLHLAAYYGRAEAVRVLIAAGASPEAKSKDGKTPLDYAVRDKEIEAIVALAEAGAKLTIEAVQVKNHKGQTPLDYAVKEKKVEVIVVLVEAGAKLTLDATRVRDSKGQTLLDYAYKDKKIDESVKVFIAERKAHRKGQKFQSSFNEDLEVKGYRKSSKEFPGTEESIDQVEQEATFTVSQFTDLTQPDGKPHTIGARTVRLHHPLNIERDIPFREESDEHKLANHINDNDPKTYIPAILYNIERFCRNPKAQLEFRAVRRLSNSLNHKKSQLNDEIAFFNFLISLKGSSGMNDQERITLEEDIERQGEKIEKLEIEIIAEDESLLKKRVAVREDLSDIYDLFFIRHEDGDMLIPEIQMLDEFIYEEIDLSLSRLLMIQEKLRLLGDMYIRFNEKKRPEFGNESLQWPSVTSSIENLKKLLEIVDKNIDIRIAASLKAVNKQGQTALHQAAREGDLALVKALIDRGADSTVEDKAGKTYLNITNKRGRTVLHFAVVKEDMDMIRWLIEQGADSTAKDKKGQTPMMLLQSLRQEKIEHLRAQLTALSQAIDKGIISDALKDSILATLEYTEFGRKQYALLKEDMRFWVLNLQSDKIEERREIARRLDFCKRYTQFCIATIMSALNESDLSVYPPENPIDFLPRSKREKYTEALQEKVEDRKEDGESKEKEEAEIHSSVSPESEKISSLGIAQAFEAEGKAKAIFAESEERRSPPPSPREGCLASNRNILLPLPELRAGHALKGPITDISEEFFTPIPT